MKDAGIFSWQTLTRNLREARERLGLTQVQVQAETGIAQSLISRYERGRDMPSSKHLELLAAVYGIEVPELYGLRGIPNDDGKVSVAVTWKLFEKLQRAVRIGDLADLEALEWVADQVLRRQKEPELGASSEDAA